MRSKHVLIVATAIAGLALPSAQAAERNLSETRTALEQWVGLRKLISEEQNDWRAGRETLASSIELIKSEMKRLEDEIARADESATAADKDREKLDGENRELKEAAKAVSDAIGDLEYSIVKLHPRFPQDLQEKIAPLYQRIPKEGKTSRAGTGERLQNVVGILSEVEKFNRAVTVTSEIRQLPNGDNAQVDTIYIGLGAGFFVDGQNQYAGILKPTAQGWVMEPNVALAPQIRDAVLVYRNEKLAEFVPLPVDLN